MVAGRCRYYQVDDDEVPTALRLEEYDGEDDYAWLLLARGGHRMTRLRTRAVRGRGQGRGRAGSVRGLVS